MTDPVETLARLFHGPWYDSAPEEHKEVSRRHARAFISALVAEAVAKEREACAKEAETEGWPGSMSSQHYNALTLYEEGGMDCAERIAAAIRARTGNDD